MSENLSSEQVKDKHVRSLPGDVGPLYHALYNSLTAAYLSWILFKDLFAKSKERVDLLNRTAGTFFLVIQETLRRDVLLAIARITDSVVTGRTQENATIETLVNDLRAHVEEDFGKELSAKALDIALMCKPIRAHRNKTLAHSDKRFAIGGPDALVLPGVTVANVDAALEAIADVLNRVSRRFDLGTTFFEDVIHAGGARSLMVHRRSAEVFHDACQRSKKEPNRCAEILQDAGQCSKKER